MQAYESTDFDAAPHPMMGCPFCLDISVAYELAGGGLVVATTATNLGDTPCPHGCGQHPYLSPGSGLIDDCTLEFEARTRILTDNQHQLLTGREPVAGAPFDFSTGKRLGSQMLDFAFTDLARDDSGRALVRLSAPDGHRVTPSNRGVVAEGSAQSP